MKINKTRAVTLFIWYFILLILKGILGKLFYPIAYLLKDWTYGDDVIKNYTRPKGVQKNLLKKIVWFFLDDDQPKGYCEDDWWFKTSCTKFNKFICSYKWSAIRNPMYNINYNYLSNQSNIIYHEIAFGDYAWNKKLRNRNGDDGYQLVWFKTEKGQNRFIFSMAKRYFGKLPLTGYIGWNPNFNGRFTVAGKFK